MDSCLIFPPGASQLASAWASTIQLGSWIMADPGPDYGAKGLIQSQYGQNALRDGGVFAYRHAPVRHMAIPLMINTPSPAMWESSLRNAVTPGAIMAVQPEGVPSAQAVYFDVLDGRWEPDYNIFHNRANVRQGTLYLDTQPWGYWPTEILLASAASVGWMGQLAVNGASVVGDVPPLAHVMIAPTAPSSYPLGSYYTDMVAWSLGARPSFVPFIPAASWISVAGIATLTGNAFAPGSQMLVQASQSQFIQNNWTCLVDHTVPSSLEPAFRGRFRAFAFVAVSPSWGGGVEMIADAAVGDDVTNQPALATSNQIATAFSYIANAGPSGILCPSPAFGTLDMGELTLPPGPSGFQQPYVIRLWSNPGGTVATGLSVKFAGMYLLPVDGAAGILTRGLVTPSINAGIGIQNGATLDLNSARYTEGMVGVTIVPTINSVAQPRQYDRRTFHRGVAARLGASTTSLSILSGDRVWGSASGPVVQANVEFSAVSVSYRPLFQFLAAGS